MANRNDDGYLPNKAPKMPTNNSGETVRTIPGLGTKVLVFLGRGRFTNAFRLDGPHSRTVILYTFFEDFSKSILAQAYREHSTNPHLPKIKRLGRHKFSKYVANVYQAQYYKPIVEETLSQKNRDMILHLQELHDTACNQFNKDIVRSRESHLFNEVILRGKGLGYSMKRALEHLAFAAEDWGDHYLFDSFKTANLGLDSRDNLILVDPMFDMQKIQRDHNARERRRRSNNFS